MRHSVAHQYASGSTSLLGDRTLSDDDVTPRRAARHPLARWVELHACDGRARAQRQLLGGQEAVARLQPSTAGARIDKQPPVLRSEHEQRTCRVHTAHTCRAVPRLRAELHALVV